MLVLPAYPKPLRDFRGFGKVPDTSKITRFKQDFLDNLQPMFKHFMDLMEPIYQAIGSAKADMTVFDSSGIEASVTENNPKYANQIIKQPRVCAKFKGCDKSYDPYKVVYDAIPPRASASPEIKQPYINGHFYYVSKLDIVTNGLGIIRHIPFYNKDFVVSHPNIVVEKKTDSPGEDKSVHDSELLVPTLEDFFARHPLINPKVFLGDVTLDSVQLCEELLSGDTFSIDRHFSRAYIPLSSRPHLENIDYMINDNSTPCYPHDPSFPMKFGGDTFHLRCGLPAFKSVYPKMKYIEYESGKCHHHYQCDSPHTTSPCERTIYIYSEKDLRTFLGTIRGAKE